MVASEIKVEKTFCFRKMHLEHTCATPVEGCKVISKWVAKICESSIRTDPRTGIEAVMEIDNQGEIWS